MAKRQAKDAGGAHMMPSNVDAENGAVVVDGPDGVAVTMTPDAAIETSERMLQAGLTAQGQRVSERRSSGRQARPHCG